MKTIKGPAIFLAQFAGDAAPFNTLADIARWAAGLRLQGRADPDLGRAAVRPREGRRERDLLRRGQGRLRRRGRRDHRALDPPAGPAGRRASGLRRAVRRLRGARGARQSEGAAGVGGASRCCSPPRPRATSGLTAHATFSGALAWPYLYPWPQRPAGLIETALRRAGAALAADPRCVRRRGRRRLLRDPPGRGPARRRHLRDVPRRVSGSHSAHCLLYDPSHFVLQQLDYLDYIDLYHERIKMFHVKDAEFRPTGRQGVYGGFQPWIERAGRFRSLGDGQVDFARDLLEAGAVRLRRLGGAGVGVLHQAPRAGRARGRAVHRRPHHPRDRAARSTISPPAAPTTAANRRMLGIG